jgi:hypothetical protein
MFFFLKRPSGRRKLRLDAIVDVSIKINSTINTITTCENMRCSSYSLNLFRDINCPNKNNTNVVSFITHIGKMCDYTSPVHGK